MPSRSPSDLILEAREKCKEWLTLCAAEGIRVAITCTWRSQEEQDNRYEQGRTLPGRVVTWTRHSKHTERRAWDFCILKPSGIVSWEFEDYRRPGEIAESLGLVWGGRWERPDAPHIQLPDVTEVA